MPRGNGTGPMGMGSMTGRGAGTAAAASRPGLPALVAAGEWGSGAGER